MERGRPKGTRESASDVGIREKNRHSVYVFHRQIQMLFGAFVCQNNDNYDDLVVVAVDVDFNYCLEFIE